jgi:hypothetical protein
MKRWWVAAGATVVVVLALVPVALVATTVEESEKGLIGLQGVSVEDLRDYGLELSPAPAAEATIPSSEANQVASEGTPGALTDFRIKETVLVEYSGTLGSGVAWAVNADPSTVRAFVSGPAPHDENIEKRMPCDAHPDWAVTFVSAKTGRYLFAMASGGPEPTLVPAGFPEEPCPQRTDYPAPTAPATQ